MSSKEQDTFKKISMTASRSVPFGARVLLYGTHARGDARPDSDWDILIILDKSRLDNDDYTNVSFPFVMLGSDLNVEINPIMYTKDEWQRYHCTPFYENVEREGIPLI